MFNRVRHSIIYRAVPPIHGIVILSGKVWIDTQIERPSVAQFPAGFETGCRGDGPSCDGGRNDCDCSSGRLCCGGWRRSGLIGLIGLIGSGGLRCGSQRNGCGRFRSGGWSGCRRLDGGNRDGGGRAAILNGDGETIRGNDGVARQGGEAYAKRHGRGAAKILNP